MKKYSVLVLIFFSFLGNAQIQWKSFADAKAEQMIQPKKILINFYTESCKPCEKMDGKTYSDPDVINYINKNFYAVRFQADGNEQIDYLGKKFTQDDEQWNDEKGSLNNFTRFMNVSSLPTTVFLDENSQPITNLNGFLTSKELEIYLKMISTNDYKNVTTRAEWEAYTRKLQSKIRD